jgi:hypothetical protein
MGLDLALDKIVAKQKFMSRNSNYLTPGKSGAIGVLLLLIVLGMGCTYPSRHSEMAHNQPKLSSRACADLHDMFRHRRSGSPTETLPIDGPSILDRLLSPERVL